MKLCIYVVAIKEEVERAFSAQIPLNSPFVLIINH